MEIYKLLPHWEFPKLSSSDVVWLMRSRRVTIRQLALANNITMKRVREIRATGKDSGFPSWEFHRMVEIAGHH